MDKTYRCVACLGSNFKEGKNIKKAVDLMTNLFPDIQWGKTIRTKAEGGGKQEYSNKAVVFHTTQSCDEVIRILKGIEFTCGRTHDKECNETIPIDIDLLRYGERVIKPEDLKKEYTIQALLTIPSI